VDRQYRAGGEPRDALGDGAEKRVAESGTPVGSHDDEIVAARGSNIAQLARREPGRDLGHDLDRAGVLCGFLLAIQIALKLLTTDLLASLNGVFHRAQNVLLGIVTSSDFIKRVVKATHDR
jgi:hypothetical protein